MSVTHLIYGLGLTKICDQTLDWDGATIQCSLHTNAYTPNQDTHDFFDDATNEHANSNGYTTKGITLTTTAPTYDAGSNEIRFDATTNPQWTATGSITAQYAIIWEDTGGADSTDPLIAYVDFGQDETATDGTFTITWATNSVFKITVS